MNQNILVIGANGYIGINLVPFLLEKGEHVTACGRNLNLLEKRLSPHPNLALHQLDLANVEEIDAVLERQYFDLVFFLVHGMAKGHDFIDYELQLAQNLATRLSTQNVGKLIYLSSLMPEDTNSAHLLARQQTGDVLRTAPVPIVEVRSGVVIGPGSAAFEIMRDIVCNLPLIVAPKWVHNRSNPIALEDLLYYLGELCNSPRQSNLTIEVCGPDVLSYADQLAEIARQSGVKHRLITLSSLSPRFTSRWLSVVTSVPASIGAALLEGLGHDFVGDGRDAQRLFPRSLTPYKQAVSDTLAQESEFIRSEVWGFDEAAIKRWQPGFGYYPKCAGASLDSPLPPEALWPVVNQLGSREQGYFFANGLWRLREWLDWVVGGKRPLRQQPDRAHLQIGDRIDSWKVIQIKPNHFISLLFGMKGPGLGRLEVSLEPLPNKTGTRLLINAWWHPQGIWGLGYWYAMFPAHLFIFKGMVRAINKKAQQNAALERHD